MIVEISVVLEVLECLYYRFQCMPSFSTVILFVAQTVYYAEVTLTVHSNRISNLGYPCVTGEHAWGISAEEKVLKKPYCTIRWQSVDQICLVSDIIPPLLTHFLEAYFSCQEPCRTYFSGNVEKMMNSWLVPRQFTPTTRGGKDAIKTNFWRF